MRFVEHLSARASLIQRIIFWLAPLACLAGVWFTLRHDPNTQVDLRIDRAAAIARGREYALTRGVDVSTWTSGCKAATDNDRYFYFRLHENGDTALIRRLAPEVIVDVLFVNYETGEIFTVTLAPDGQPLGFRRDANPTAKTAGGTVTLSVDEQPQPAVLSADTDVSRAAANAELARIAAENNLPLSAYAEPMLDETRRPNVETRTPNPDEIRRHFSYRLTLPDSPEIEINQRISVIGEQVVRADLTTKIDEEYAKANFLNHQIVNIIALVLYGLLIAALVIYALYRYLQLTRQKEVPHARSLLLAALAGTTFFIFAMQTDFILSAPGTPSRVTFWIIFIVGGIGTALMMGLAIGIAFGAGEGAVREAYPGKLASLDALMTGRIFSRNVARAVLIGACLGSWLVLLQNLTYVFWLARPDGGQGLATHTFEVFYGNLTAILPIINPPMSGLMVIVPGLLLPLALFHRRLKNDRRYFVLLIVLCVIANFGTVQQQPMPFLAVLLQSITLAGVLLASFFFFDLLTAIVVTAIPSLVVFATYLASQPAPALRQAGWISVGIAAVILLVEIYCFFRGRTYTEDEVRPLYARHLAERVRMQAEVSAAREAQVRLMPAVLPRLSGLSVAAECRPARTVGGDFFDVFPLDEKRIGVFVAEGGERGLEAALTIAFAKGFLMPRLKSNQTPGEVVCSLQTQLAPMLDLNQSALGLTYAVFDTQAGKLDYARTGDYPRVVIRRMNGDITSGDTEQVWNLASSSEALPEVENANVDSDGNSSSGDCLIHEATFTFEAGDAAVIITDGIAKTLPNDAALAKLTADITRLDDGDASKKIARGINSPPEDLSLKQVPQMDVPLRRALAGALKVQAKRARKLGIEDDLTAVVLRYDFASAPAVNS